MSKIDYHPLSEVVYGDEVWPLFDRMRDEAPDFYLEEFDCHFLTRFQDIWEMLPRPEMSVANGQTTVDLLLGQRVREVEDGGLAGMDPPDHTDLRSALMRPFTPAAARRLEPLAREIVQRSLEDVRERGEADAIADVAMRLSVRIACTIIGIPLERADWIVSRVNRFFDRSDDVAGVTEAAMAATLELNDFVKEFAAERAKNPGDPPTLADQVIAATPGGRPMSQSAIESTVQLAIVGGTETLPKVFAAALYRLWQHPEQRAEVAANPRLVRDAFWETLRYDMPTQMLGRTLLGPVELHGKTLPAGQKLMFLWPAANRDPREFDDPQRFDIHRKAPRILSFGHATHRCLGANMALMEGRVLLEEWLRFAPEYDVLEDQVIRLRSEFFRGFGSLPVSF